MIPVRWRRPAMFATLAVTIVFSVASRDSKVAVVKERPPRASPPQALAAETRAAPPARLELENLRRRDPDTEAGDGHLFESMSWYVPPPPPKPLPPSPPPPPPPPTAPPLPFSFLGRYVDGKATVIMLVKDDRIYTVSEGDVIDNTYRIGHLSGGVLELTYLPLNIKQTLTTG
jgi:hypothetical protein